MSLKGVCLFILTLFLSFGMVSCSKVELEMSDGSISALSDYEGQWLLINYWAIWCKPCIEEIPELNQINLRADVSVLGYNFDRKAGAELAEQAATLDIQFPLLAEDPAGLFEQEKPSALPATMVLNQKGEFVKWLMGPQTEATILASF